MPHLSTRRWTIAFAILLTAVMLPGCGSLEPVRKFGDETRQVGAAFTLMPSATTASCHAQQVLKDYTMPAPVRFELTGLSQRQSQACGADAEAAELLLPFAMLVEQYAETLVKLTSDELPDYQDEFDGLEKAVAGLKDKQGNAIVPADKAGAIIGLGKFLGKAATQHAARSTIRELLAQEEGLNAAAGVLRWYTERIYRPMLANQIKVIDVTISTALPTIEAREPLAARWMMISLAEERAKVNQREQAAANYTASIDKVLATRATLLAKLDQPKDEALREQLSALAKEVRALRRKLASAL
ncbi:hypothetical protein LQ564_22995 [Massilia sp. G4R7]|uniref:Lipoprotein n=1 Tax=Massilia phyllostachyos TaxID=2898585 RepID=A0ABS8QC51_9BURK|nr:hypothetical protein [Massilia phyllostachyos]MCD2519174.1 hypothetical protein [Massilia phyllostachyos]